MDVVQFIAAKRDGQQHRSGEVRQFIAAAMAGEVADYQLSAWLMAAYLRGLAEAETVELTEALRDSGRTYPLGVFGPHSVDKHSTGGVGDKTTLVVVPLCAALGAVVPKLSGRGLGFTGGTLDKLESIPGFQTRLSAGEFERTVARVGAAIAAQSADLVPADGRLYALRDVTATVDSTPLIAASVMSKKLAVGCPAIVLDVKVGSGAFMTTIGRARELALTMVRIGSAHGRRVSALMSAMDRPLGMAVGNALEVREALDTLRGHGPADFTRHCISVASEMLLAAGVATSEESARSAAEAGLSSGKAEAKFLEMVEAQGGSTVALLGDCLPRSPLRREVAADRSGYLQAVDARAVGLAAMALGAGRQRKDDPIDPGAGVLLCRVPGDEVIAGDHLAALFASSDQRLDAGRAYLRGALPIGDTPPAAIPLVHEVIRS